MVRAVLSKELKVLWASPIPWIVGALLHAVLGLLYVNELEARGQAVVQPMVPLAGFLLLALLPLLTMRTFAEERRQGTLDLLLAVPVPARGLAVGKWLAVWLTSVVVLVPALAVVAVVSRFGDPDWGPVLTGFIGLALFGAALTALGTLASSATAAQPVAAMVAFFASLVLWFAHVGSDTLAGGGLVGHFSISERLRTFAAGGVTPGDVAFFSVATAVLLVVAAAVAVRRVPAVPVLVVLLVLVTLEVAADRSRAQLDLTADDTLTLSAETREVVDAVDSRVVVTVFLDRADPTRVSAPSLLSRYRRLNRRISFRLRDPQSSAGEARRLGVDPVFGGLAFESGGVVEQAPGATEQDVTAALARLVRRRTAGEAEVCVTTGHGEADIGTTGAAGLSTAASTLQSNGYRVASIDLLTAMEVPASCGAVLVASPTSPFGEVATSAVQRYLEGGGRAIVLLDPASTQDLSSVLSSYALGVERGLVLEGDAGGRFSDDPFRPVVRDYRTGSAVVRRLAPTFFPAAQAVTIDEEEAADVAGLTVAGLAYTSRLSFLEKEPQVVSFDEGTDVPGPIAVVAAADKSANVAGEVRRTRIVVVGDVDFATNEFIGEAANSQLLTRAVDWATLEESLVTVSSNIGRVRPLRLTEARLRYLRLLASGLIPAMFIVLGALVWAVRRGR